MKSVNNKKITEFIIELIYIAIGAMFIAIGINLFLLPNKMTTGGATGIATVTYYIFNIPMGITTILINIPLFVLSILKLGKSFAIKTIISTMLLSIYLDIFKFDNFVAIMKSLITYCGNAISYFYTCKGNTIRECLVTN